MHDPATIMTDALLDMARAYGLGTPENRAIVAATEHARITAGLMPPWTHQGHPGPDLSCTCVHSPSDHEPLNCPIHKWS